MGLRFDGDMKLLIHRFEILRPLFDKKAKGSSVCGVRVDSARSWGGSADIGARRTGINLPGHALWTPLSNPGRTYHAMAVGAELVAKREHLISQYARAQALDGAAVSKAPTYSLSNAMLNKARTPASSSAPH